VQKKLIDSVHTEAGSRSIDELAAERDEVLLGLIELRNEAAKSSHAKSGEPVSGELAPAVRSINRPANYSGF
jgi:hypothetical protein